MRSTARRSVAERTYAQVQLRDTACERPVQVAGTRMRAEEKRGLGDDDEAGEVVGGDRDRRDDGPPREPPT